MPDLITLRPISEGPAARLYSLQFAGRGETELSRFLRREDGTVCSADERARCRACHARCHRFEFLSRLAENLQLAVREDGFQADFFQPLDKYETPTGAFSAGTLRVFGIRFGPPPGVPGPSLFVAGDGGLKLVGRIYDAPALAPRFRDVLEAARRLQDRLTAIGLSEPPLDSQGRLYFPDELLRF